MTFNVLLIPIIAGFLGILFLNFYFRLRVLRIYRTLLQHGVEFDSSHLFHKKKMEAEILPRYPHLQKEILAFAANITFSVRCAGAIILLITALTAALMFFGEKGSL